MPGSLSGWWQSRAGSWFGHISDRQMPFVVPFCPLPPGGALHSRTCNGSTPLHLAAREGLLNCVEVLVQNGANVHAQDAMGCKPIDYCKVWNHRICAR